ncbi:MAG TPA: SPFH domain-containing protein [Vicinamibacterales bacterium]|jgi:regulator of protease activity HflC (stomatin/prohibitin superfamily)|nr:SPFH domain-containing protein [Vicinamibacterales bacterium]
MVRERLNNGFSGWVMFFGAFALLALGVYLTVVNGAPRRFPAEFVIAVLLAILILKGNFIVAPNQAVVLQLFGSYVGTAKQAGLRWVNPLYSKKRLSLRIRNFESAHLKVNDANANPIEIAAVVVWRVVETAEALFEVDDYQNYVKVQTEAAVRNLATSYPYDSHEDGKESLRGTAGRIADHLKEEVQDRLAKAGVEVLEARISHLAYAPEIAAAMLQRQQAGAIIAARQQIVEGAVGMVDMALQMLSGKGIVHLDEERKAAMVSNLLVVLCGERSAQPVVNTGTIYQ